MLRAATSTARSGWPRCLADRRGACLARLRRTARRSRPVLDRAGAGRPERRRPRPARAARRRGHRRGQGRQGRAASRTGSRSPVGSQVRLTVTSDVDDEVHVHGYDIEKEVHAGQYRDVRLHRDQTGVFEVETHEPSKLLLQLQSLTVPRRSAVSTSGQLLAHGVGSREDLPIPFSLRPDRRRARPGRLVRSCCCCSGASRGSTRPAPARPLPAAVQRALDGRRSRAGSLRALGLLATSYVAAGRGARQGRRAQPDRRRRLRAVLGRASPLLSLLLGPVWRLLNPMRDAAPALLRGCCGTDPEAGLAPLPAPWLGYWPAALSLLVVRLARAGRPDQHDAAGAARSTSRATSRCTLLARDVLRVAVVRPRPTASRCSPSLLGRLSVLRPARRRSARGAQPARRRGRDRQAPGLFAVVGVLLGSTRLRLALRLAGVGRLRADRLRSPPRLRRRSAWS